MNLKTIEYETIGDIAFITLKNTHSCMRMVKELTQVCDDLEDKNPCKVVVIRGTNGHFNRGLNFEDFNIDKPMDIHGFNKWEKICVRIERLPKVTIAALEGDVVGGGLQLALVTDVRLASPSARFQFPEVKMGFLPGMGVYRLAKYVGLGRAKRLILQCAEFDAEEAVSLGLVDAIHPDLSSGLEQTIDGFRPIHPITVQLARRLLNESYEDSFENAIGHFLAAQHRAIGTSAFLDTVKNEQKTKE